MKSAITIFLFLVATTWLIPAGASRIPPVATGAGRDMTGFMVEKVQYKLKKGFFPGARRLGAGIRRINRRRLQGVRRRPLLRNGVQTRQRLLLDRTGRPVYLGRSKSSNGGISAGVAVRSARARVAGEVLRAYRQGGVFKVKIDTGDRIRVISVDARTGRIVRIR